jgi:hypothetical protein
MQLILLPQRQWQFPRLANVPPFTRRARSEQCVKSADVHEQLDRHHSEISGPWPVYGSAGSISTTDALSAMVVFARTMVFEVKANT